MSPELAAFLGVARAGRIADSVLRAVVHAARPGVRVTDLDRLARMELAGFGARPAMLGYADTTAPAPFPLALSLCLNGEISGACDPQRILMPGDLATADLVVEYRGWHADAAVSWVVPGRADERRAALAEASRAVTAAGVRAIRPGEWGRGGQGDWSSVVHAMSGEASRLGVTILKGFDAHAIGRTMHAPPRLPAHPDELDGFPDVTLRPGMVFTIEPVVAWHDPGFVRNGWLERTVDGSDACFTEVTVGVTRGVGGRKGRVGVLAGFLDGTFCMT